MDAGDVLLSARKLIEHGWCCGADARDEAGNPVDALDPAAASWSLAGALGVVACRDGVEIENVAHALAGIAAVIADPSLDAWNDRPGRTQAATLEALDLARVYLEQTPLTIVGVSPN
jgi:hypothetical protein